MDQVKETNGVRKYPIRTLRNQLVWITFHNELDTLTTTTCSKFTTGKDSVRQ